MPSLPPFAAAWSRSARRSELPGTPEPMAATDGQPPSAPRPRFRLKRRNTSNLNAPTQHFLASVAAADIPIPSIEEPRVLDEEMVDNMYTGLHKISDTDDYDFDRYDNRENIFSPPKTPAPGAVPSLSPKRYPDWTVQSPLSSLESSPEYECSRPSTARSTQTESSLFSCFSMESDNCSDDGNVEDEQRITQFGDFLTVGDAERTIRPRPSAVSRGKRRRVPWSKAMSDHLWSIYDMYLQDPKVTPFYPSKSGIPPSGVCIRVAREAKRSWRGALADAKSCDMAPPSQSVAPFAQWPHTCATTRAHLRELCKANARSKTRGGQSLRNSPAPFGKTVTCYRNRCSVPPRASSIFSGQEMAVSLAVSTSESMQPQGPLAQITGSEPERQAEDRSVQPLLAAPPALSSGPLEDNRARLGSPFVPHSYGPSESNTFPADIAPSPELPRQNKKSGSGRSLKSPVRLTRSRSNTNSQKLISRRQSEAARTRRPSLGSDFWTEPPPVNGEGPSTVPRLPQFSSTTEDDRDVPSIPRMNLEELFEASRPKATQPSQPTLAPPAMDAPARLGSPFALKGSSFSFPSRFSHPSSFDLGTIRRPFATVQQPSDHQSSSSNLNDGSSTPRSSLLSRLAYIDKRLKDFRHQERARPRRRSESPL